MVEVECFDGRPTDGRMPDDVVSFPAEVSGPVVSSRVEQRNGMTALGIGGHDPIRLPEIAPRTAPGEVPEIRGSPSRDGHNVLQVEGGALKVLVHAAVFATPASP